MLLNHDAKPVHDTLGSTRNVSMKLLHKKGFGGIWLDGRAELKPRVFPIWTIPAQAEGSSRWRWTHAAMLRGVGRNYCNDKQTENLLRNEEWVQERPCLEEQSALRNATVLPTTTRPVHVSERFSFHSAPKRRSGLRPSSLARCENLVALREGTTGYFGLGAACRLQYSPEPRWSVEAEQLLRFLHTALSGTGTVRSVGVIFTKLPATFNYYIKIPYLWLSSVKLCC